MYSSSEIITDATSENHFSTEETIKMRDKFVERYCTFKNWNKADLSMEQISEIRSHAEWKNPGMLRS